MLWGLVAFGGHFDVVHDVVEDGLVDVEDAGAKRCLRWFLGGPMADGPGSIAEMRFKFR